MAGKPNRRDNNDVPANGRTVWGKPEEFDPKKKKDGEDGDEKPKVKADFGLSGVLATDEVTGNVLNGTDLFCLKINRKPHTFEKSLNVCA